MSRTALLSLLCCAALTAHAGQGSIETAMNAILAAEGGLDIMHAEARPDGVVEVVFGGSVSEHDQMRVVERLRAHPEIHDVTAWGSPSTFCRTD